MRGRAAHTQHAASDATHAEVCLLPFRGSQHSAGARRGRAAVPFVEQEVHLPDEGEVRAPQRRRPTAATEAGLWRRTLCASPLRARPLRPSCSAAR